MNKTFTGFLVVTMMALGLAGCAENANPTPGPVTHTRGQHTLDDQADRGKVDYGAFREGVPPRRYTVTDFSKASQTKQPRSAHGMAYELESIDAVKGCAVVVVDGSAYVGVRPAEGFTLDPDVEAAIRAKITEMDMNQGIRRIYVTSEPNAVEFLSGYSTALEQGRPIEVYKNEFQNMVSQTWPNGQ